MTYRVRDERDLPPTVRAALERQEAEAEPPGLLESDEDRAACERLAASTGLSVREVQYAILTRLRDHQLGEMATGELRALAPAAPEAAASPWGFRAGFAAAWWGGLALVAGSVVWTWIS